jgi:N-acetylmuramoyl-L-alanine amidase
VRRLTTLLLLLSLSLPLLAAAPVEVKTVRIWSAPEQTRLVLDTSGDLSHKVFALANPDRLVIDVENARLQSSIPRPEGEDVVLAGLRSASMGGDRVRLVLDLKQAVRAKSFMMKPNDRYGHRLVVELEPRRQESQPGAPVAPRRAEESRDTTAKKPDASTAKPKSPGTAAARGPKELVVAIDAGHGGEDPGAIGSDGTKEKDVVLAVARELAALVRKEPGMRPVMIRDGDYFISLGKRVEKARRQQADLFVSIHADAFQDDSVRGSSVFTLSHRGASSAAARWLADRENRSDLVGGVDLDDKDNVLASVLLDLSQSATMEASLRAAGKVLSRLKTVGDLHKSSVQQAGFVVLKAPDVPSMLVELAFISNEDEEQRLRSAQNQQQFARALMSGIRDHFKTYRTPGNRAAQASEREARKHVISRGETLSGIADQYAVGLSDLRRINKLADDQVRTGQTLAIPDS